MNKPAALVVDNITKSFFNKMVLNRVSFELAEGEIVALLGPSGCGKSTLLFLIAGLENPDYGTISWQGIDQEGIPSYRRCFGLMFQDYALFPHMDVFGNVAFGLRMSGVVREEINAQVRHALELVDLEGYDHHSISTLSGGEAQRVALARALAPQPSLLMLDEPLGSVDRTLKERLLSELNRILRQLKQTAIYVTHDQEEAFTIADRVVLLRNGQVEQIGKPRDIYLSPASRFVAEFLGLTNFLPGHVNSNSGNTLLTTPLGDFPIDTPHRGNVTVLIHPDGMMPGSKNDFQVAGRLIETRFLGNTCRVAVQFSSIVLNFEFLSNSTLPEPGEIIYLNFDPQRSLQIFPEPFQSGPRKS